LKAGRLPFPSLEAEAGISIPALFLLFCAWGHARFGILKQATFAGGVGEGEDGPSRIV
jgi:hypothetical protein